MILATSIRIGGVETSSVVTWYGGDLVAKACRTYCVRPAGRCRCVSSASYGLAQGLQRATVTRGLAAGPERFEERSRYSSLSIRQACIWGGGGGHPRERSAPVYQSNGEGVLF